MQGLEIRDSETKELMMILNEDHYIGNKNHDKMKKYFAEKKNMERANRGNNFVFVIFEKTKKYLEAENMKQIDITRLIVLSTYVNYNGKLMESERTPMTEKIMKKIVRLSKKSEFFEFKEKLIGLGIMSLKAGEFYLDKSYFCKGEIGKMQKDMSYARLYCNAIQYIFENIKASDIKRVGYLFQLLPYIHYDYNIICWNPEEREYDDIRIMDYNDIMRVLEIKKKSTITNITDTLHTVRLKDKKCILGKFEMHRDRRLAKLVVNPDVIYKGDLNNEKIQGIRALFKS